jgi:hypothetical protein
MSREFIIYRDSWRRGGDTSELVTIYGQTELLNHRGMMCCLGQCAIQLGLKPEDIEGVGEPDEVSDKELLDGVISYLDKYSECWINTNLTRAAMSANDNEAIDDATREDRLVALFREEGEHTLRFVDGVAPWPLNLKEPA